MSVFSPCSGVIVVGVERFDVHGAELFLRVRGERLVCDTKHF